jgi:hypothetical protein
MVNINGKNLNAFAANITGESHLSPYFNYTNYTTSDTWLNVSAPLGYLTKNVLTNG